MSNTYTFANLSCDTFDVKTSLDMCGFAIQNLAAPTAGASEAARQQDVTSRTGSVSTKKSCRYSTASNISDFTTKATVEAALDPVSASAPTLVDGDRVLVFSQSTTSQNGIYQWDNTGGELVRASDADGSAGNEVSGGDYTFITEGDNNAELGFIITGSGVRTLGVDAIVWTAFTGQAGTVSHTTLSNIGSNTHTQISNHIADATLHFTEGSISHTNILNKGTNTHAQIDSHIASTSNPHSVTFDQITPTTTKGDLILRTSSSDVRFPVGTDGQILVADSTQTEGVAWATTGFTSTKEYERFTNYGVLTGGLYYTVQQLAQASIDTNEYGNFPVISNDGTWLVVADRQNNTTVLNGGRVFIYSRSSNTWSLDQIIESSDLQADDAFGTSVAISSSPATYIVVGANREDTTTTDAGSVYVFFYNGSTWNQQQKIQASDASTGGTAFFGSSVDIDESGTYIVVGAPNNDADGTNFGRAYIYTRSGSSWGSEIILTDPNGLSNGYFGQSVAMDPAGTYVAIGRPRSGLVGDGYIYIFSRSTGTLLQSIQPTDIASVDGFGNYIKLSSSTLYCSLDTGLNDGYIYYISNNGHSSTFIQNVEFEYGAQHVSSDGLCLATCIETTTIYKDPYIWNSSSLTPATGIDLVNKIYTRESELDEFREVYTYGRDLAVSPNAYGIVVFTGASSGAPAIQAKDIEIVYTGKYGSFNYGISYEYLDGNTANIRSVAQSKDGAIAAVFTADSSPVRNGFVGLGSVNIYKKNTGTGLWEHRVQLTTDGGDMADINNAGDSFLAISSLTTSGIYYIALYPSDNFYTTISDLKQKIFVWTYNPSTNEVTSQAELDLQDGSGGSYTPGVNAYVNDGLDCDVVGTIPYYIFGVYDPTSTNRFLRYRSTAGSYGFVGPTSDDWSIPTMYGQYGSAHSIGDSTYSVFRSSGSVQTISTSTSYDYSGFLASYDATVTNFASNGDTLFLFADDAKYKTLPSTFSTTNVGDRVDLFEWGGSTYDFVRPIFVELVVDNSFPRMYNIEKIINVSEDGNSILASVNNAGTATFSNGIILAHDNVSTEWNMIRMLKYPYQSYVHNDTWGDYTISASRDDFNSIIGLYADNRDFNNSPNSIIASNVDEPDPTQTTSSAAKENGSSVGDFIQDDSNKLIRVMPVATHALDPEWITPLSVTANVTTSFPIDTFYVENTTTATTTNTAFQTFLTTTEVLDAGTYLIEWNLLFDNSSTVDRTELELRIDGTSAFDATYYWGEQPDNSSGNSFGDSPFVVVALSGSTTFDIRYRTESGGTARIYYGNIHGTRLI